MILGIMWTEWFGYAASVVVALSLTMSSIVKLRWLNLAGASMFSTYGFIIGALPVGFLNLFIVLIDIWYLFRMYREKDDFRIMGLSGDGEYLQYFLDSHRKDILKFFPDFDFTRSSDRLSFYLVKNSVPIGVLTGRRQEKNSLLIELDYVRPEFRDFRMGTFVYGNAAFFRAQGIERLMAPVTGGAHDTYLLKMNFINEGKFFVKAL